jgi:hypothetical protein
MLCERKTPSKVLNPLGTWRARAPPHPYSDTIHSHVCERRLREVASHRRYERGHGISGGFVKRRIASRGRGQKSVKRLRHLRRTESADRTSKG